MKSGESGSENMSKLEIRGVQIYPDYLSPALQKTVVEDVRKIAKAAPFVRYRTPSGKEMSVRMTAAGKYGWISDSNGYRYAAVHPGGSGWPDIPRSVLTVWRQLVSKNKAPECCLVNYYDNAAKMGLHQDRDEKDFSWPVLSISLGDRALFRIGNRTRGGKTKSIWLNSGDVVVMGSQARLVFHGVDRVDFGSSTLLQNGGRLNLTLRVVD